jgi:putative oxidoreductase
MESSMLALPLVTHTLIGFYFAFYGFWNAYHWGRTLETMVRLNIPHPWLFLSIGITWQVVAGFMIIFNIYTNLAALSLMLFTGISVFIFHPFWKSHGEMRALHMMVFMTNIMVTLSALLMLISYASVPMP